MRKIWPWEDVSEIPMHNGMVALVVTVPPYAYADAHAGAPPPPSIMVELRSATGSTELVKALPGTPEWEIYQKSMRRWERDNAMRTGNFRLDFGIVGWKYRCLCGQGCPEDGTFECACEVHDMPPPEWKPPDVMERWGRELNLHETTTLRVSFIKYVLIQTSGDDDRISAKIDAEEPPTKKEVRVAANPSTSEGDQTEPS